MPNRPKHMPDDTPDFLAQAWVDCLRWASSDPNVMQRFLDETGVTVRPVRTPLDALIDEATDVNQEAFEKFLAWFNENIWGSMSE